MKTQSGHIREENLEGTLCAWESRGVEAAGKFGNESQWSLIVKMQSWDSCIRSEVDRL